MRQPSKLERVPRDKVKALWRKGGTYKTIAKDLGFNENQICGVWKRMGLTRDRTMTDEQIEKIRVRRYVHNKLYFT